MRTHIFFADDKKFSLGCPNERHDVNKEERCFDLRVTAKPFASSMGEIQPHSRFLLPEIVSVDQAEVIFKRQKAGSCFMKLRFCIGQLVALMCIPY